MKLLRYGAVGRERPALLDPQGGDARSVGGYSRHLGIGAAGGRPECAHALPLIEGNPRIGPCVGSVGKIICVGLNCSDHAAESGMPAPREPIIFLKASSAIAGPNDDIQIPRGSERTDWEVELGVVIGEPGKYIPRERALQHVAGYCVINDLSEREYQLERGGQWDKGKGCDTFAPIGPWLVTAEEIANPQDLEMWLEVDERRYQSGTTRTMIFGVTELITYISQYMSLQSGDIISTGTPPAVGLGQKPTPIYLKAGQTMRLGIAGLGVQQQRTVAHAA